MPIGPFSYHPPTASPGTYIPPTPVLIPGTPGFEDKADQLFESYYNEVGDRKKLLDLIAQMLKSGTLSPTLRSQIRVGKFLDLVEEKDRVDVQGLRSMLERLKDANSQG